MQTYQENSIVIVKDSNVLATQKKILKENLKGVKVIGLQHYLQSYSHSKQPNWTLNYEIRQIFKNLLPQLHYLKGNVLNNEFINECRNFLEELHFYKITPQELPTSTQVQIELKILIESIYSLKTKSSCIHETLSTLNNIQNTIIDIQYPTYQEKFIIQSLINKGALLLTYEKHAPIYELNTANNARCELEAIAQRIIHEEIDIKNVLIAYCDSSYNYLIESVFDRYQLPIHIQINKSSSLAYKCIALLKFAIDPSLDHFMNCLQQGCFKHVEKILEAQKIYPYNYDENYPNIDEIQLNTELFSNSELKQLSTLIHEANIQKESISQILHECTQISAIKDLLLKVDEILRNNLLENEINSLSKIQSLFVDSIDYLHELSDLSLLIDEISKINEKQTKTQFNAIECIPYSQINEMYPISFICGASQTTFNEFNTKSGIFDEDYVKEIKSYPSLMERYEYAHKILIEKCENGHQIIFSFPQSDYLGKNFEPSLDIENITKLKPKHLTIQRMQSNKENIEPLSIEIAKQTYTKNNKIRGSISSLEKYVGCPYAYFLKYGCHIQEPVEVGFNVQKIGTLNHSIVEDLVNKYQKDYSKASIEEVSGLIKKSIEDMKHVFPHLQFDLIEHRLLESMKLNLFILDDMEQASFMTPTHCEYKWTKDIPMDDVTLSLVGYIDRIDTSPTAFRIIDYKSSSKKLEKDKVFSGQQLQLCTYAMIMNEKLNLRPLGGFYYSFMNSKLNLPYQKYHRREKEVEDLSKSSIESELIKKNRLQGWIFDDNVEIMDDTATHVMGVSNTKSKGISAREVYSLDEISECIVSMMKQIVNDILSGNVKCEPNEAACMFCKYKPICRFNGTFTEKKQLVELPACMRKEKNNG